MSLTNAQNFNANICIRDILLSSETSALGFKTCKTRYSFMPCANADGSLKLKLILERLIFKQWFNEEFIPSVRQLTAERDLTPSAFLLLDNCTAHYDC
ncbi:uncharacterized protein LOC120893751 [Anopheles arabiensis]|uniref:uncharacterized protein LOC120893751 n=1 Tax=Anopheles arabiensis TaxID=7173 RepID=UPI001AAD092B|nr:uncharacterized protein LOC120893751 [Anopheles arabiensis]